MSCLTAEREAVMEGYRSVGEGEETGSDPRAFLSFYGTTLPRVERQTGEAGTGKPDYWNLHAEKP
jgi:hypothetical protein